MHRHESGVSRGLAMAVGFGIGVLWLLMAASCFWAVARGIANDRSDWVLAWGLVGTLLAIAGTVAMVGTWYHQTRILGAHRHPHH